MPLREAQNLIDADTMKVALLGAPGSGKTKLAKKLSQRLNSEDDGWRWKIIDGYVNKLAKRVGHEFGAIFNRSAYRCNLQVVAERWTLEDEAAKSAINTITCGTIYETMVYAAAQSLPIRYYTEDLMMIETHITANMMESLGTLAMINYDYDALFYLPHPDPEAAGWASVVNAKLDEVLKGQHKEAIVLDGTSQQRIEKATSTIKALQEARTHLRSRVRTDRTDGEEQGDQPERVPDLSEQEDRDRSGSVDLA